MRRRNRWKRKITGKIEQGKKGFGCGGMRRMGEKCLIINRILYGSMLELRA